MPTKSSPHWLTEILKDKFVKTALKVILVIIIVFLLYIVIKSLFGYPVKIAGFEVNTPILKTDTVSNILANKHDTIVKFIDKPSQPIVVKTPVIISQPKGNTQAKGNTQTIDSGGSGIQNNNSPNYGQQAGRDINNVSERKLTDEEKSDVLIFIKNLTDTCLVKPKKFTIFTTLNTNGAGFASQLSTFLIQNGYISSGSGIQSMKAFDGVRILIKDGELRFLVGNIK